MNWKEFFKPYKRKIIITIILSITAGLLWFGGVGLFFGSENLNETNPVRNFLIIMGFLIAYVSYVFWPIFIFAYSNGLLFFILIPFNFIYWYILSCLIVWIYDKYKKK